MSEAKPFTIKNIALIGVIILNIPSLNKISFDFNDDARGFYDCMKRHLNKCVK